jgi:hypothetical protein
MTEREKMKSHFLFNNAKYFDYLTDKSKNYELTDRENKEYKLLEEIKKFMDNIDSERIKILGREVLYYDKEGKPLSTWRYQNYLTDLNYKIVKQDTYGNFFVSTVWIGMDHSFSWMYPELELKPLIFETMIFCHDNGPNECKDYQERYCTEQEAIEGHNKACEIAAYAALATFTKTPGPIREDLSSLSKEKINGLS